MLQERQGDITEDETVKFKSYLMSLGIDDPVTREACKSSNEYFRQLAMQLSQILEEPIKVLSKCKRLFFFFLIIKIVLY